MNKAMTFPPVQPDTPAPARAFRARKCLCILVLASVVLAIVSCRSAKSDFYQVFMASVTTNDLTHAVLVTSPALVDTNNTAPKLAAITNSFRAMCEQGTVSGVSLGMSMSAVVARWGKPPWFYTRCGGGPRFAYSDVALVFHGDSLWEVRVHRAGFGHWAPPAGLAPFGEGLSMKSSAQDLVRVLGEPTRRTPWGGMADTIEYLVYEAPQQALFFTFDVESGTMAYFFLQRRGEDTAGTH
jgi:hypothetical protein